MATLQIEEFSATGRGGNRDVPQYPPVAIQNVAVGGSSTQATNAFGATTRFVRLTTDTACHFKIGSNPTAAADATSSRLPADTPVDIGVKVGHKIAVITG